MAPKHITQFFILSLCFNASLVAQRDNAQFVDPFIGTGGHGHTYPGATMPFGMVQVSPDTRNDGSWDGCAGYHFSDSTILGFSHTHLSGTGVSDYGDILIMPVTGIHQFIPGASNDFRSSFRHQTEKAEPGYYSVFLDDYGVKAEMTSGDRVGYHRYTFEKEGTVNVLLDLIHRDPVIEASIHFVGNNRIEGLRRAKYWAGDQYHYFAIEFSKPIEAERIFSDGKENSATETVGKRLQAFASFSVEKDEKLEVKIALSAVSIEGARKNLEVEGNGVDFDAARVLAKKAWNRYLSMIDVEGGPIKEKRIFYTSFYHCLLTPNLYSDVDGNYRGMDGSVHHAEGFKNYTVFSLWDTFRALHPLLTILDPDRTVDFVKTLVHKSKEYGELPMWELAANDTRCMIGYHAVSVIADAYAKGIRNFDLAEAYDEMKKTAMIDKRGLKAYRTLGYVPSNKSSQGVSKTLEYAYDDWCVAQIAKALGKEDDYTYFTGRSQFYRNVFDSSVGFMRGRADNHTWVEPFDPKAPGYNYTEGNAYQYSLFVPHDVSGFIGLLGGQKALSVWLDSLFTVRMEVNLGDENDISGLIGQYAHGNEPSHHMAYFYNYAGEPWKTQQMVRRILNEQYDDTPGGLDGNEDCGQMSAWYVISALGLYAVCPGQQEYAIGTPLFEKATIHLDNGKEFVIQANGNAASRPYIQHARLNDAPLNQTTISHQTIMAGGELVFDMGPQPNKAWGIHQPVPGENTRTSDIVYLSNPTDKFIDKFVVEMKCDDPKADIYYTLDGSTPDRKSKKFVGPFEIRENTVLQMRSYSEGRAPGYVVKRTLTKAASIPLSPRQNPQPGLRYSYYEGIYRSVYDFSADPPAATGIADVPGLTMRKRDEWIGLDFHGLINIPEDGEYTFFISANDGCQLNIDGEEQFESDGRKSEAFAQQASTALKKGFHHFQVKFYQCSDSIGLTVEWQGPGFTRTPLSKDVLSHLD
jgi:predicted alpha-1,2-mannosidase